LRPTVFLVIFGKASTPSVLGEEILRERMVITILLGRESNGSYYLECNPDHR
ncbi:hypothetical protein LCGC14_1224030, partial [marine sediment metagenome]